MIDRNLKDIKKNKISTPLQNLLPVKLMTCSKWSVVIMSVIAAVFILHACKKETVIKPPPIVTQTPAIKYQNIKLTSGNQIQINQISTYQYELNTTGTDPYLSLEPLTASNPTDSVVLTFEYQCSADIGNIQIFFASPITEERSVKPGTIPSSKVWKSYSVDLGSKIKQFSWGNAGDFLRLDFGNQTGVNIQIRNIYLRALNAAEKAEALVRDELIKNDLLLESNLKKYLSTSYSSQITEVKVGATSINIKGSYTGTGEFSLCEIAPYDHLTQISTFVNKVALSTPAFSVDIDRYVTRNGFKYDRLLSKWVIAKIGTQSDEIVSYARYAGQILSTQNMPAQRPSGRKGLGGYSVNRGFGTDLDDLNISSVTVNIPFTAFMYSQSRSNAIAHTYGDKTYYFDKPRVEELDRTLQIALSKNIVVAAIILVQKASQCADPEIGKLLQHPDYTSEGIYTMPNMTTPASVNCYAAALDFLASRYCRSDNSFGRIHHWIMHNEVDAGLSWTNMGDKPMLVYLDTYIKSMRLCYNIARNYDENSEVFCSFTHSWAAAVEPRFYAAKEMLKILGDFSVAEGDFQWGVAYHSYPENLFEPKTWNDKDATFSMNSPLVTFKNLEVLNAWIKKPENKYKGTIKRTLWLSENGTNSKTYGNQDMKEQAAGFAYTWEKLKVLDGIDAMQWHNWIDNRAEGGLHIGLRRFPDDQAEPGGRKPVWFAYQAADTNQEDVVFEPYKSVIGIKSWDEVRYIGPIQ
ncbi:MAG: DUF5722 domain-containing protein [Bacteroidetes bacterium]|nr:DUF5722 domain-containing protein [Bacteroidota bacterium]